MSFGFVVQEEKRFVFLNRAAEAPAELIQVELFFEGGEIALGIELRVSQVLVEGAVEAVGAGLGGDQHGWAGVGAVFGGVVIGENFEFID